MMKVKSDFKNVIFDLGGVLVDLDKERCVRNFCKLGLGALSDLIGTTHQRGILADFEAGLINGGEFCSQIRRIANNGSVSDADIRAAWVSMLCGIRPEKLELLRALKDRARVFLLSNVNEFAWDYCLKNYFEVNGARLTDFFDDVFLSYKMKLLKPDLRIYEKLLKDAGLNAADCLFIDDSKENCEAAERLGIHSLQYKNSEASDFASSFLGKVFLA